MEKTTPYNYSRLDMDLDIDLPEEADLPSEDSIAPCPKLGAIAPNNHPGCVGDYQKGGRWYYRYTYYWNGKLKHKHIGPFNRHDAIRRAARVRVMIANGDPPSKILRYLDGKTDNLWRMGGSPL